MSNSIAFMKRGVLVRNRPVKSLPYQSNLQQIVKGTGLFSQLVMPDASPTEE